MADGTVTGYSCKVYLKTLQRPNVLLVADTLDSCKAVMGRTAESKHFTSVEGSLRPFKMVKADASPWIKSTAKVRTRPGGI